MKRAGMAAAFLSALLVVGGLAQAQTPEGAETLDWMQGVRVHTNDNGSQVLEAFLGPVNGVVTGTALTVLGPERAYTEYHKIGPNADGVYGLDVANTANGMNWTFTPLKSIEPGKITFQTANGALTISYAHGEGDVIDAQVVRVADGQTTTQNWHFVPVGD